MNKHYIQKQKTKKLERKKSNCETVNEIVYRIEIFLMKLTTVVFIIISQTKQHQNKNRPMHVMDCKIKENDAVKMAHYIL